MSGTVIPSLRSRPGLAAIELRPDRGGGVGYVARLLERALTDLAGGPPAVVALRPARPGRVGPLERARFASRVAAGQARRAADWWVFDHLHVARVQRWVPARLRRRFAVFLHGVEVWRDLPRPHRATLAAADVLLANSRFTAARVAARFPEAAHVVACPLGLLPDDDADAPLVPAPGPLTVLVVGRMSAGERYKGHDGLIECWPAVRERIPEAVLLVVGEGDDRVRLEHKAREAGLGEAVRFTGFLPRAELARARTDAAVFAMPSRGEGFGLVYLEAMRAGLPCIGSTADAAAEVIEDGETGFLVDPDDSAALADRIARLLESDHLRRLMGAAGRRRFEAAFTYEHFRGRLARALAPLDERAGEDA